MTDNAGDQPMTAEQDKAIARLEAEVRQAWENLAEVVGVPVRVIR